MGGAKRLYGPWSKAMLEGLRKRGLLSVEAFVAWFKERDINITRTLVSHWIAGRAHLPADLLPHLSEFTERPDVVFAGFLRAVGFDSVKLPVGARDPKEVTYLMLEVGASVGRLQHAIVEARAPESDGGEKITKAERDDILEGLDEFMQQIADLKASVESVS